jgi:hypothetical protein
MRKNEKILQERWRLANIVREAEESRRRLERAQEKLERAREEKIGPFQGLQEIWPLTNKQSSR